MKYPSIKLLVLGMSGCFMCCMLFSIVCDRFFMNVAISVGNFSVLFSNLWNFFCAFSCVSCWKIWLICSVYFCSCLMYSLYFLIWRRKILFSLVSFFIFCLYFCLLLSLRLILPVFPVLLFLYSVIFSLFSSIVFFPVLIFLLSLFSFFKDFKHKIMHFVKDALLMNSA